MNYYYAIIPSASKQEVDFNEALPASFKTITSSLDNTKVIMSWKGDNIFPTSISNLPSKEGPYTIQQMRSLLTGSEWI